MYDALAQRVASRDWLRFDANETSPVAHVRGFFIAAAAPARQLGDVGRDPPCLVINLSVHILIPVSISPQVMDGILNNRPLGAARGSLPCVG